MSVFDGGFELAVLGGWPVAVVVALITSVLVFRALRTTPRPSPAITALRVATLLVACIVVIQPTWSSERVERTPGELAIIVDASRSMSVRANGRTRYDRAKALLERWSGERRAARAAVYTLDDALRPTSFDGIESGSPDGQSSRIAAALSELAERGASSEIGAVVLVTDGRDTDRALAARSTFEGMRVHVVAVGTDDAIRDDAITEARADARAYLRGKYTVRATLRAPALAGQTVPVTLERDDEPYQSRDVAVDASGNAQVVFELPAERMGLVFLRIAIPVVSEDAVPENNVRSMIVRVVRDRLRVLHVSGRPSWDMRFMRGFLKRDPSIDLVSFFILRTTTDLAQADPSEMSLIPFPTDELFREHLSSFDVVVFQDFEFRPYQIAPYLPAIRHYVRGGGSFVMIGGEGSFSGGGYGLTAIADILPVEVLPGSGDDLLDEARFHPVVPDAMTRHPLVAHGTGDVPTSVAWRSLGEAIGTNVVGAARPGAVTLLEHPTRTVNGARMPVLSIWDIDEGRALALTVDTSWRWGMPTGAETGDGSFFTRFWDRAFRWRRAEGARACIRARPRRRLCTPRWRADHAHDRGARRCGRHARRVDRGSRGRRALRPRRTACRRRVQVAGAHRRGRDRGGGHRRRDLRHRARGRERGRTYARGRGHGDTWALRRASGRCAAARGLRRHTRALPRHHRVRAFS